MKSSNQPLKSNPFTSYRDPKTGQWVVIKPDEKLKLQANAGKEAVNYSTNSGLDKLTA